MSDRQREYSYHVLLFQRYDSSVEGFFVLTLDRRCHTNHILSKQPALNMIMIITIQKKPTSFIRLKIYQKYHQIARDLFFLQSIY